MKITKATFLILLIMTGTAISANLDEPTGCLIHEIGKPDDEDWSKPYRFQDDIEATLQNRDHDWREFALGFESEDELPVGYLQLINKGNAIDITLRNWDENQEETQQIPVEAQELFINWTTISLHRSDAILSVTVDGYFDRTFSKVNAEPLNLVYGYVPADQYIYVGFDCERGGSDIQDQPHLPTETIDDLSLFLLTAPPEQQGGQITAILMIILLMALVATSTGLGYCFWRKKKRLLANARSRPNNNRELDGIDGVSQTLLTRDHKGKIIQSNTPDIDEALCSISELYNKSTDIEEGQVTINIGKNAKNEPNEDRNSEITSANLHINQCIDVHDNTAQRISDSQLQELESQIISVNEITPKVEMNYSKNIMQPLSHEISLRVTQKQNLDNSDVIGNAVNSLDRISEELSDTQKQNPNDNDVIVNSINSQDLISEENSFSVTQKRRHNSNASTDEAKDTLTSKEMLKSDAQVEKVTKTDLVDNLVDIFSSLQIDDGNKKDNHDVNKASEKDTQGPQVDLVDKNFSTDESTFKDTQSTQGFIQEDSFTSDCEKAEVCEEPITCTRIEKMGEIEGTVPSRLQEILFDTNSSGTDINT